MFFEKGGCEQSRKANLPSTPLATYSLVCPSIQWRWKKCVPCAAPITKESLVVAVSEGRGAGDVAKMDLQNRIHGTKDSRHAHQSRKKCVPCVGPITREYLVVAVSEGRGAGDVAKMDRQNHTRGAKESSHAHQTIQPPQLVSMFHYKELLINIHIYPLMQGGCLCSVHVVSTQSHVLLR